MNDAAIIMFSLWVYVLVFDLSLKIWRISHYFFSVQKTLEAFMIILSLFELLYLLALHAGNVSGEGYGNAPAARNVKDPNYGTPAATAV